MRAGQTPPNSLIDKRLPADYHGIGANDIKILLLGLPVGYHVPSFFMSENLGLGYLASSLRQDGHEVEIFDAQLRYLNARQAIEQILSKDFDCLGITANHAHRDMLISTSRQVKKHKKDAILVAGGYLPTLSAQPLLSACPELDFVVRGEGESAAREVFRRVYQGEKWQDSPGVAYLHGSECVTNPLHPLVEDLDSLPFPARDAILQAPQGRQVGFARVIGSRGCYHRCSFCCIHCFYSLSGNLAPRLRRPEKIVDEIESTIAITGIRSFRFSDDDFIGPSPKTQAHVVQLAEELKKRKPPITFDIECRADVITEDILRLLKDVGMTGVFLGIESGVQSQLDRYNKCTTVEQNRQAIDMIRNIGLQLSTGFIAFDPYVTIGELAENIQFLNETGIASEIDRSSPGTVIHKALTRVALYPGVPLAKQLQADGLLTSNGMRIEYRFKDRWVRMLCRTLLALESVAKLIRRLRPSQQK